MNKYFKYIFWSLLVLYIVFYMPYGFEDTDIGYIFGTSWEIYNGQLPYVDFNYIKPPVPPYFHTFFLFISEEYAYVFDRSFYYVQVFVYSLLIAKILTEKFKLNHFTYFIAALGAIVSIHNYPPMAWNTIDGIFFTSIGCYFIFKNNTSITQLFIGALAISLGVLSKQSFYFFPVFLAAYLVLTKDYYRLKFVVLFGILFLSIFIGTLYFTDTLNLFIEQTFSFTPTSGLIDAGIKAYYLALKFNILYVLLTILIIWILSKKLENKYIYLLLNICIATYMVYIFLNEESYLNFKEYLLQLLFLAAALYTLILSVKDKKYWLLLLMLSLSWCASISNGFKTPISFSLPIIFAFFLFFNSEKKPIPNYILGLVIGLFLITFYIGYQNIYNDSDRKELNFKMGELYPQLKFIKSDEETFNKYAELKQLAEQYPNFTVFPTVTLAHYLNNTVNPIGIDWVLNHELGSSYNEVIDILESKNTTILVENDTRFICDEGGECSRITKYIQKNWQLIETKKHFKVYRKK